MAAGAEDGEVGSSSDQDFDDCVAQVESVNPTTLTTTTRGMLKVRSR